MLDAIDLIWMHGGRRGNGTPEGWWKPRA